MIPTASTTAWAIHDLALASSFGGSLFGKFAFHPAVCHATDARERGQIIDTAWKRFSLLNLMSHGVFAATWLVGRHMLTGREIDRRTRALVTAKDIMVATAVASGVTSMALGVAGEHDPQIGITQRPKAIRASKIAGYINLAALAGVVGVTAVLAMKAGTSTRWS